MNKFRSALTATAMAFAMVVFGGAWTQLSAETQTPLAISFFAPEDETSGGNEVDVADDKAENEVDVNDDRHDDLEQKEVDNDVDEVDGQNHDIDDRDQDEHDDLEQEIEQGPSAA